MSVRSLHHPTVQASDQFEQNELSANQFSPLFYFWKKSAKISVSRNATVIVLISTVHLLITQCAIRFAVLLDAEGPVKMPSQKRIKLTAVLASYIRNIHKLLCNWFKLDLAMYAAILL
ncbi:unnamed protein product [Cylicocyclus nassatus]|uniref:Uncharacterized protein n=1 Tax=Cylicocyclus nassatus TaxID=53992 RepID=A0AA36GVX7_CYLNA|nr:unnamed protein product [Cylicocyclus nassatus]CAJ0599317.1 unnamed protein product [Cylicocyclus nassatus]